LEVLNVFMTKSYSLTFSMMKS